MSPATLQDTARWLARARWLELRCFEVLGGWVATTPEAAVKLALARQSHHHAWHAELFERVLPVANGLADHRDEEPGPGWTAFMHDLRALDHTADRLTATYALLLPAKLAEYERWFALADPVRDAPVRRWLGFVLADERADLAEGRRLLDALPDADRTPARTGLEAGLRAAGPLLH